MNRRLGVPIVMSICVLSLLAAVPSATAAPVTVNAYRSGFIQLQQNNGSQLSFWPGAPGGR